MPIIFSYIFYFVIGTVSPLQRRWLIKNKDFTPRQQISFTFQCILILFIGSLTFPLFSPFFIGGHWYYLLFLMTVCGIFGAINNIAYYIAQKHLDAGVTTIVANIYTPVTILLSSFLPREGLTLLQVWGTLLLLVAIVLISKKHKTGRFSFDKYFMLMVASGLALGVLLVAERALQKTTGFSAGTIFSWGSQAFALGCVALFAGQTHTYKKKEVLTTGILQFLHATSWVILVYSVGNLSLVSSVTTFKVVFVFLAAAIFLREREDLPRKVLGSIIAVIGLLLMK